MLFVSLLFSILLAAQDVKMNHLVIYMPLVAMEMVLLICQSSSLPYLPTTYYDNHHYDYDYADDSAIVHHQGTFFCYLA